MDESRRGARVATTFLVAVEGIDREPTARKGDISATGAYFETTRSVGGVGTIHWLYLVSADRVRTLRVMAYVVRTLEMDAGRRRLGGVAFEFMPDNDDAAANVHAFVRHVLSLRRGGDDAHEPHIVPRVDAQVGGADADGDRSAMLRQLSVRSMLLQTSWAIAPGESVRVDIVAPGMTKRIRLDGRAVRVVQKNPGAQTWDIEVEIQQETDRPLRTNSSMSMPAVRGDTIPDDARITKPDDEEVTRALDDLLSALILPAEDTPRKRAHQLSGQLSSIKMPTLISLFEMERMTGKLVVVRGAEERRIFVRDGKLIDVEPIATEQTTRGAVMEVLAWDDGAFEFSVEPVSRANMLNVGTTALLIDLAREADEKNRDASEP